MTPSRSSAAGPERRRRVVAGEWRRRLLRAGHRGLALAAFAAVCFTYGSGLLLGYHPTFAKAGHWPVAVFGWVFIGVGLAALTGVPRADDRWQFALAEAWVCCWFALLVSFWNGPVGWNGAVSWLGVGSLLLVASGWPDWKDKP